MEHEEFTWEGPPPDAAPQLSKRALTILWSEFCGVQAATWLIQSKENMERFNEWLISGNDDDAWS